MNLIKLTNSAGQTVYVNRDIIHCIRLNQHDRTIIQYGSGYCGYVEMSESCEEVAEMIGCDDHRLRIGVAGIPGDW